MRLVAYKHSQRGMTLLVGMIMLVLITMMVTTAFTMSTSNLKAVGNMQAKDEAIAAANFAIEDLLEASFTDAPAAKVTEVDINGDGTIDYKVSIAKPTCVRTSIDISSVESSATLSGMSTVNQWNTVWDIEATVNDAKTGAKTAVRAGVRVLLTQAQKTLECA